MSATPLPDPRARAVDYDPFAQAPLARVVPSTEAQREIWLAAKLDAAASLAYNESVSLRLAGALDAAALRRALQALLDRHEALRATFSPDGRELCIAERIELPWQERDLAALEPAARAAAVETTRQRVVETPFDLERGPLVTAELLRLGEDEHLLLLNTHHLVCDGWSFGVLVRELAALYAAERSGEPASLPAADSFAEFALAEARHPDSEACRDDERYWLARYAQLPAPLELPLDRPRPRRRTTASRRIDCTLDAALVGDLRRTGARRGASLYATLLAGFAALLQRLTGEDDQVIGIPAAGQAADGHHALVGHAVNVLPLRVAFDASAPFADALERLRGDLLDAFEHQRYTFGTLLKRLALARDPARLPLVSVLFNLDQAVDENTLRFADLHFELAGVPRRFENFELFINAVQVDGALRLECQYNADLFDAATVARWLDAYATLLRAAADDPQQALATLPLLSAAGLAELRALQPAPTPFEAGARVEARFFAQAAQTPERPALRCGDTRWSYAQLAARAERIAAAVRTRGVGTGALVGIALERGPDMLAAVLGVLRAGAGYVPLDPAFPRERLAFMAADAKLALLVTQAALADTIAWPHTLLLDGDDALPAATPVASPAAGGDAVAYVIYTSGSTGKPKGVRVPHRAVVNFLASMRRRPGLAADDRLLAVTTLSFDIAVLELLLPLGVGAEVVLATREQAADGYALAALLAASAANVMQATPATWRLLLEAGWPGGAGFKALCGGEALAPDLAAALLERCGTLWNLYGPTETTVWSTCAEITAAGSTIPIGRPIDNTTVWVLDAARQPCPVGVPGELAIGGAGVTLGYLDRPELTADRFIADPFGAPGARLYRTGDRGRWRNDGTLEHLGRLDFQVKLRGYRIELGEIEARLAEHADIARAVVLVREDRAGDQRLVAYVTPRPATAIDEAALRRHLRATLPEYMLPQHVVVLDALPLLPNGKLDRKALPPPLAATAATRPATVAPRTDAERRIVAAMEETLALPGIGVDDDFFALGGHSLLAAQLTARLNREFGVALSLRALFDTPTAAGLAATVAGAGAAAATPFIARRARQDRAPLSLLQKRLWLFEQLCPGTVVYNTPSAHRLRGRLDQAAFERAFNEVVRRQPVLRTCIGYDDGEVVQVVHDEVAIRLFPAEDLSALPAAEREGELARRLQALTDTPFDLAQAPLFRVRMYRLAEEEHALFFMPHHIVWDGWSFDLLYAEIAALYAAFQRGQASPLPALPVSYGDFAAWHGEWLRGPEYAAQFGRQLAAWRERFATRGAPRPLPTDRPRGPGMAGAGETEWLALSKARTEALRELARDADATVFMVMLAAYYALLYRTIGDGNLVVGTPVRVRSTSEVEPVMGLFTNLLPLPLDLDPAAGFLDLVAQVKRTLLDGLANADVQLEDLMHEPGMREAAGTTHFYQAQFSYQDARQRIRDWGGLAQEQILLFQRGASEDLAMWFLEHTDGMTGGVLYNADLLDAATVQRLARDYLALLDRVLENPRQSIAHVVGSRDDDLVRIQGWNAPAADAPATSLAARFEAAVDRAPDAPALLAGSWTTRYRELEQQANRIAACLRRRGAGAGSVVALAADAGAGRIAGLLGILKAGATCVPLDPRDPPARLRRLLADAAPALLVGDARLHDMLGWPHAQALWLDADAADIVAADATRAAATAADPDAAALAVYTSNTAGTVRATAFSHRFVGALLDALQRTLELGQGERILGTAAPDSALALLECLLALVGGHVFVEASRDAARDGAALAHDIGTAGASVVFASADAWRRLVDAAAAPAQPFRAVCVGGTPPPALAERIRACCGGGLWNALASDVALLASCGRVDTPTRGVDAGAPLRVVPLWVLDGSGQPLPVGAVGEIAIARGGTAFGREATGAAPAAATPVFGAELLRSGWRGRWRADGRIEELGRLDRRLLIDGRAVEPAEIEALLQAQAGVRQALVRAAADAAGNPQLLAYAVVPDGAGADAALRLRAALETNLPAAAVPAHLFVLAQWPTRADGSIDTAALPTQAEGDDAEAPVTAAERLLAGVWHELLGVPSIARDDNFFDLGGHSLLAMTMVARVEKLTRVRLNLLTVANGSLRALAMELPDAAVASAAAHGPATLGGRLRDLLGFGRRSPRA
ncbi:MAG: amino acid adenylation domain-containing protein [Rhodanobacteraceae bacterium]|nr:amino acid adenylation domain-containing protein [Rhodanobacteraceae bacterium]